MDDLRATPPISKDRWRRGHDDDDPKGSNIGCRSVTAGDAMVMVQLPLWVI